MWAQAMLPLIYMVYHVCICVYLKLAFFLSLKSELKQQPTTSPFMSRKSQLPSILLHIINLTSSHSPLSHR